MKRLNASIKKAHTYTCSNGHTSIVVTESGYDVRGLMECVVDGCHSSGELKLASPIPTLTFHPYVPVDDFKYPRDECSSCGRQAEHPIHKEVK